MLDTGTLYLNQSCSRGQLMKRGWPMKSCQPTKRGRPTTMRGNQRRGAGQRWQGAGQWQWGVSQQLMTGNLAYKFILLYSSRSCSEVRPDLHLDLRGSQCGYQQVSKWPHTPSESALVISPFLIMKKNNYEWAYVQLCTSIFKSIVSEGLANEEGSANKEGPANDEGSGNE